LDEKVSTFFPATLWVSDRNINGNATPSMLCRLYLRPYFYFLYSYACKKKDICNVVSGKSEIVAVFFWNEGM
jgi:hypothetical protein